jgi:hypothetical protein
LVVLEIRVTDLDGLGCRSPGQALLKAWCADVAL